MLCITRRLQELGREKNVPRTCISSTYGNRYELSIESTCGRYSQASQCQRRLLQLSASSTKACELAFVRMNTRQEMTPPRGCGKGAAITFDVLPVFRSCRHVVLVFSSENKCIPRGLVHLEDARVQAETRSR